MSEVIEIQGMSDFEKRVRHAAKWVYDDWQKLKAIDERVGQVYVNYLKANIKDADQEIIVYNTTKKGPGRKANHKGTIKDIIKQGTLRRSIKVFRRSSKWVTLAGPKRGKKIGTGKRNTRDGWFASIVEQGAGFGPTRNQGIFMRGKKATHQRMRNLQDRLLQAEFKSYMK
jgi:hypothetical protein